MKVVQNAGATIIGIAVVFALGSTGCATKKYVRNTVAPLEQRIGDLDKKTGEHEGSIEELENGVSRAHERAMTAEAKASAAGTEAARANEQAALAGKQAGEAHSLAERGLQRAGELDRKLENLDNYKLVLTESVPFAFDRSDLSEEAQAQLDEAAEKIAATNHYVIEVQGFTDKTGPRNHNLELSKRRAASVVRYLTSNHGIPLHRIYTIGYGSDAPVADNSTREGRKQNRRVEVRLFTADLGEMQISSSAVSR